MKLDHIGIAVTSIEAALAVWRDLLGLKLVGIKDVPHQKVRVAMLELGETHVELLEALSDDGTIKKFIDRRGEGLHHVSIEVTAIEEHLERLKQRGVQLIDAVPRPGAAAAKVAFIHPQSMTGVLVELCEKKPVV